MKTFRTQFLALLALMLTGTGAVHATDYDLYVKGSRVTSSNASNILGDGHVSYNASTKTLTLSNATITYTGTMSAIRNIGIDGLTINVVGSNTINSDGYIIGSMKSMHFKGTGSLKLNCTSSIAVDAISFDPRGESTSCVIDGPQITINCNGAFGGSSSNSNTVTVTGTTTVLEMNVTGSNGVCYLMNGFTIGSYLCVTEPAGCYYSSSLNNFTTDGSSKYVGKVVIKSPRMYVGETAVTPSNASDILGNGQFRYDYASKTLTVTNASLDNQGGLGSGIRNDDVDGFIIKLVGTSTLTTRMNGISSNKNFSITGTGTLNVTAGSRGIMTYCQSAATCTINGPTLNITASNYALEDYYGMTTLSVKGADTRVTLNTGSTINAVYNLKSLTLSDGLKIVHPYNASFNSSSKTVTYNGSACKGTVAIGITYGLYIGETMVTSYNYNDVNGDGMFAYRPASKTLDVRSGTLTNTEGTLGGCIDNRQVDGLTVHLTGSYIYLNARNNAVYSEKSMSITGPGTLNATSTTSYALGFGGADSKTFATGPDANGYCPTINLIGKSYGISDYRSNTTMALQGKSTVLTMQPGTGYAAVNNLNNMTFSDGLAIVTPSGPSVSFYSSLKSVSVNGSDVYKGKVEIAYDYGIFVGETKVSKLNYADILGNGQFKYNPDRKTLTVYNATLDNQGAFGNGIDNRLVDDLIINVSGTNKISARNAAVTSARSISFTGTGTLDAFGEYSSALTFWSSGSKTCTVNGPTLNFSSNGYVLNDYDGNTTLTMAGTGSKLSLEQLTGNYATVNNLKGLSLGSYYITEPAGAYYSSSLKSITLDGSTPTKEKVLISSSLPDLGIWIGNTRVTPENCNDILGNGQLSYNVATKTLTMNNFNYVQTTGSNSVMSSTVKGLTVNVVGTNSITSNNYVIGTQGSITFTGTGTLTLKCDTDAGVSGIAIWTSDQDIEDHLDCTFDGPKVTIISPNGSAFSGSTEDVTRVIVKGSTTYLDMQPSTNSGGSGCMFQINDFVMGDGISIYEPKGAYFSTELGDFTLDGKTEYKGRVVASADIDLGISVGETIVKTSNAADVLGNGQFSYDPVSKTLTVKDAYLDNTVVGPSEMPANQGAGIINWRVDGLTVKLEGDNTFKVRNSVIASYYPMTISGRGKLNGKSTESAAISLQGDNTVLTIDGPTMNIDAATYAIVDANYHKSKVVVTGKSDIELWSGTNYATIKDIADLQLGNNVYINQPAGGYFSKQLMTVTTNGSTAYEGKIDIGYYYITIGETRVTPDNARDVLGDGTVSYSADAKILTLNNARITNSKSGGEGINVNSVDGLNIKVLGYNTVTSYSWGLGTTKNFSITGTGSLTITSTANGGITPWSQDGDDITCTIDGPQLTIITPTSCSFAGSYGHKTSVVVKGSTTRVDMQPVAGSGYNGCLFLIDEFTIGDGLYVTEPYGAYFDPALGDFTLDGASEYKDRVVIGPAEDYGFLIADEVVTTANAKDVLGNGQFSYDPATKVLTMKDANVTKTDGRLGTGIDIRSTENLTINVEGTNYIKTRNEPIASLKSFRITGTGTLNGIAAASEGMLFWTRDTMTCTINGPKINIQALGGGLVDYYNTATLRVEGSTTSLSFQPISTNLADWTTQPIDEYSDYPTIKGLKSLVMGSSVSIMEPQNGRFNSQLMTVTTDGQNAYKGKVTIGANVFYGIYVAETGVKTSNADDILGDGCFSYDPESKTLYVRNAHLDNQGSLGSGISNREVEGMTIVLEGTSTFSTRMASIGCQKSTTITGRGTLNATSTDAYGLHLTGSGTVCTVSGPTLNIRANTNGVSGYMGESYAAGQTLVVEGDNTVLSLECTNSYKYKTIEDLSDLVLRGNLAITEPQGAWFDSSLMSVTVNGTDAYRDKVVISYASPNEEYIIAETEDSVSVVYHVTSESTVEVGAGDGTQTVDEDATVIDIPETVGEYTVTGVAAEAFEWNYNISAVYLPATIETIGYGAFQGCSNLLDVFMYGPRPTLLDQNGEPTEDNGAFWGLPGNDPTVGPNGARMAGNIALDDNSIAATLHVPVGLLSDYYVYPWNEWFSTIVDDVVVSITGDVNGDGSVNVADIGAVIDMMASSGYSKAADVNGDGNVDVADIGSIIDIMAANARRLKMTYGE